MIRAAAALLLDATPNSAGAGTGVYRSVDGGTLGAKWAWRIRRGSTGSSFVRPILDAGDSWIEWRHGIPAAPVRGIVVHPRDLDLAVGTHGRGVYIVDDIRPLMAGRVRAPLRRLSSAMDAPSATDRLAMAKAEAALHELLAEFSRVMDGPLEAFRAAPAEAGYTPLPPREPISGR